MDLEKVMYITSIVLILIILFTITYINITTPKGIQSTDIEKIQNAVVQDVRSKYPNADVVEILEIKPSKEGSYDIKVRVSENYTTTCPKRYHLYYNYPNLHFVPKLPETIVKNCAFCSLGDCRILFEEEAILASINLPGTEKVRSFVEEKEAIPEVRKTGDKWVVNWVAGNEKKTIEMSETGELISIK